jgi:GNAT superfamily N-acetyltransferase
LRPEDVPDAVGLLTQANASDDRHRLRDLLTQGEPGQVHFAAVAEHKGTIIGAAKATTEPAFPGTVSTLVVVNEAKRRQGIGTELAKVILAALKNASSGTTATCTLRDDRQVGRDFAVRYGFTESNHSVAWRFDLAGRAGELATRTAEAAAKARIHVRRVDPNVDLPVVMDVLGRSLSGIPMPYDENQDFDVRQVEGMIPDKAVILVAETSDGHACGLTVVSPQDDSDLWYTNYTGTDADHRNRGVALALKVAALSIACREGAAAVTTHNDDRNSPIQRLNKAIGMAGSIGYWGMVKKL